MNFAPAAIENFEEEIKQEDSRCVQILLVKFKCAVILALCFLATVQTAALIVRDFTGNAELMKDIIKLLNKTDFVEKLHDQIDVSDNNFVSNV